MYIAHALVINGAKSIANEWARLSAQAMREYKMFYPEKIYNTDKPLFQDTQTLLRGITFTIDVTADKAIIYLTIDDDVEPRTRTHILDVFKMQTYGVRNNKINIPARPLFYDVLGALNKPKAISMGIKKSNHEALQYNFDRGFDVGKDYQYTNPSMIRSHAQKTIRRTRLTGKFSNYVTGELRWL